MAEGELMRSEEARAVDLLAEAARWRDEGRQVALATVVQPWGSSPRPVASHLIDADTLRLQGPVSGRCIQCAVVPEALAGHRSPSSRDITLQYVSIPVVDGT